MAKFFDHKIFNEEAFGKYMAQIPNQFQNRLLNSGILERDTRLGNLLSEQGGSNYATIPILDRLRGNYVNYNGNTKITDNSQKTYSQSVIAIGRAVSFNEKDFAEDITTEDFMKNISTQLVEYWEEVYQIELLGVLEGIFAGRKIGEESSGQKDDELKKKFIDSHTLDITSSKKEEEKVVNATTLNNAIQKASGDKKSNFKLVIMHSQVATNLENLNLLSYAKYTDTKGIERDVTLATWNGKDVIITDDGTTDGADKYITYVLGRGAIKFDDLRVKTPNEMARDAKTNGGETSLISRKRWVYAPTGISFVNSTLISPSLEELKKGDNWTIAGDGNGTHYPLKSIPIAKIVSKG